MRGTLIEKASLLVIRLFFFSKKKKPSPSYGQAVPWPAVRTECLLGRGEGREKRL